MTQFTSRSAHTTFNYIADAASLLHNAWIVTNGKDALLADDLNKLIRSADTILARVAQIGTNAREDEMNKIEQLLRPVSDQCADSTQPDQAQATEVSEGLIPCRVCGWDSGFRLNHGDYQVEMSYSSAHEYQPAMQVAETSDCLDPCSICGWDSEIDA